LLASPRARIIYSARRRSSRLKARNDWMKEPFSIQKNKQNMVPRRRLELADFHE
jgi:hypothetical protein